MFARNTHILVVLFFGILFFGTSCSTKKKSFFHKQYHNINARYNGYFNGKESLKKGVSKLYLNNKDDYTQIISVFPTGDMRKQKNVHPYMDKAIKKGSVVIQRHSIKIKGKEYCKWIDDNYLMVGKAYFYKGNFKEAIKTFSFIRNEFSNPQIINESGIWLLRSYSEARDYASAELLLEELINEKKQSRKSRANLYLAAADYFLKKQDYKSAAKKLLNALEKTKRNKQRVRINYILAQIYLEIKKPKKATHHFRQVLRSSPEYDMAFNAKMNLARSLENTSPDSNKMRENLKKMAKDDKNKEYLDQIYHTLATMDLNSGDTASAVKNYKLSTTFSVENTIQKSISFLDLGKIRYNQKKFKEANSFYDSTVFYMQEDSRYFKEVSNRREMLNDLVFHIENVEFQDSLQRISRLPKNKQQGLIKNIIQEKIIQEKKLMEEQRLIQQTMYENSARGGQFGNKTGGGMWYFYNPATLSFGMSEFRKIWGKRKLEDDWRRKDKQIKSTFQADSASLDTLKILQSSTDVQFYLDQLLQTKEDYIASDDKIKQSLYQMGIIYKEKIADLKLSTNCFESIYKRFSEDKNYASLALYNIYLNQIEKSPEQAKETKEKLLQKHPKSVYTQLLVNPNQPLTTEVDLLEKNYLEVLNFYQKDNFDVVLEKTDTISDNIYKNKLLLLRAFSLIGKQEPSRAIKALENITKTDSIVYNTAIHLLLAIKDPTKINKANSQALAGSPYLFSSTSPHVVVLVLEKNKADINYLKTLISDFHSKSIGNEMFEISALLMGVEKHLIIIKSFENASETMLYCQLFKEDKKLNQAIDYVETQIMPISTENFKEFYKNKDLEGYNAFFLKKYSNLEY